jgi:hypothetical protein
MVWGTFCIVFIRLVVIHFYPKSCNSIGVLSLFSEKSCKSAGHHVKDRRYEDWNSMVLRRYLNTIQVNKICLKFQGITWRKNAWKMVENCRIRTGGVASCAPAHGTMCPCAWDNIPCCLMHPCAPSHAPCAWTRARSVVCLFSKPFFVKKTIFSFS